MMANSRSGLWLEDCHPGLKHELHTCEMDGGSAQGNGSVLSLTRFI